MIVSRTCIITGDFVLVVITWVTLAQRLTLAEITSGKSRWTLSNVLLRDGTLSVIIAVRHALIMMLHRLTGVVYFMYVLF